MVDFADAARIIGAQCACVRVRRASRALTRLYDENLRPSGLQASQLTMLVAVASCGEHGANIGALAEGLVMDRTTLTRNLVPLEKAGLVRVARAPNDARVRLVFLTRQGERAIEVAFPLWEKTQKHVRQQLGPGNVDALREELGRVVAVASSPTRTPSRTADPTSTKAPPGAGTPSSSSATKSSPATPSSPSPSAAGKGPSATGKPSPSGRGKAPTSATGKAPTTPRKAPAETLARTPSSARPGKRKAH
ncbi:MarR family winged helix-turn-helix transcriptional regulator [Chondromyces crocatus]|uniref:HTH marR-type domain-containing protein n=1 Tax=Chondromyces crocatus TaxID=52 RepID=A0A0K1ECD7_CHOCO|nr:MarR family winged helix-turn-helix transcriptional regulator [Chondromyces crocatus]AKT38228.1 uncharacterized protein CMC5_023710 [Chondromyces crocatus]